ncbi:hypothetical protein STIUS_v1c01930 [Spiroplasma sp. TIUS-1]|uniref:hypothetical protein n=1 Tax=Spiroplasma sp. TIUS-1 TaxID=216963 RepID=UPI001397F498|nr:hypothetical protein [Spiroplasma sp. TIUS-1]QHX35748.1 hypothetical protein STIUS_v1c01930 [Spiroplasma sp. TIUS-1]
MKRYLAHEIPKWLLKEYIDYFLKNKKNVKGIFFDNDTIKINDVNNETINYWATTEGIYSKFQIDNDSTKYLEKIWSEIEKSIYDINFKLLNYPNYELSINESELFLAFFSIIEYRIKFENFTKISWNKFDREFKYKYTLKNSDVVIIKTGISPSAIYLKSDEVYIDEGKLKCIWFNGYLAILLKKGFHLEATLSGEKYKINFISKKHLEEKTNFFCDSEYLDSITTTIDIVKKTTKKQPEQYWDELRESFLMYIFLKQNSNFRKNMMMEKRTGIIYSETENGSIEEIIRTRVAKEKINENSPISLRANQTLNKLIPFNVLKKK